MAAGILTKSEAEFPKNARVRRPLIGAKPLETGAIRAALASSSQHRSSDNADIPSVGIILDELADLELEQLAAAHRSNEAGSMLTKVDFAFLPAEVREGALATSQLSDPRQNRRFHRGIFIGVAAIAAVIFVCGALGGSWFGENLNSAITSSPQAESRGTSLATVQPRPAEELVKRGRELVVAGNMSAARLVLRQAAEAGNASAALELGATYDPMARSSVTIAGGGGVPRESQTVGVVSSELNSAYIATARAWYEKAKELGATEAQERLERLGVVEARGWEGGRFSVLFQRAGRRWRAQRR
jgi:hypothetical protein